MSAACPLYPRERPNNGRAATSHLGHEQTHAPQQTASSLDHFVRALLESPWHVEAERLGGLEIDHQLEFRRLNYWQVSGPFALEDTARIIAHLSVAITNVIAVAHQAASLGKLPPGIDRRHAMAGRQSDNLSETGEQEWSGYDHHGLDPLPVQRRENRVELAVGASIEHPQLQSERGRSVGRIDLRLLVPGRKLVLQQRNCSSPGHKLMK